MDTKPETGETPAVAGAEHGGRAPAGRRPFRRANAPKLSIEEAQRQGRIVTLAMGKLGNAEAIAYLNREDDTLGGRPLDLAIASADGFAAVAAKLEG